MQTDEELPYRAVYPATESLIDWLSNRFEAIDQRVFTHFRGLQKISDYISKAEEGSVIDRFKARSALREFNDSNNTNLQWNEARDRIISYVPAFIGDWVAFTDDSWAVLYNPDHYLHIGEALYGAPLNVRWAILWDPENYSITVSRSPVVEYRQSINEYDLLSCGMTRGDKLSFTLPPEIEGSVKQDVDWMMSEERQTQEEHEVFDQVDIGDYLSWQTNRTTS